jgi:glutathione synthase/RimK-type ligase-like ATP-grasp enzyme
MRLLLVGGVESDTFSAESLRDAKEYLENALSGSEVHAVYVDKLVFTVGEETSTFIDGISGRSVEEFDTVYIRGPKMRIHSAYAQYVSSVCRALNIPCVNSYEAYYSGTKFAQINLFAKLGLPFPKTVYSLEKQLLLKNAAETFGYPYILKTNVGSHGNSNYLIKTEQDALDALANEPDVDFLAQEFCPNDRDYRLLLVGDDQLLFERRGSSDSHINNTSQGGAATKMVAETLPAETVQQARKLAEHLGLHISGADIMPHLETGKFYFLEINSQPQLRTGALLEEKQQLVRDFLLSFGKH